ncbi:MAG TPA: BamA/TamA family outer membrane protein [Candidatus Eisenbacteria bacterium]|nr:BamA/TamA family outer membrane protein [Candidatus Eisenbacteria bacterium]
MHSHTRHLSWLSAPLALLAALCLGAPAHAQYFGQNKVRYESPQFRVLKTEHFDIYYSDDEREIVEEAGAMAERWYARLSKAFNHQLSKRQPLLLYPSHSAFEQTNAIPGELGEGTGGVTESFKRRIVLPVAGSLAETDHVIGHELVHAFQYDIGGTGRALGMSGGIERLPLWFIEGMAEYLSVGADDPHTAMWMRDAAVNKRLPSYNKLFDPRFFPYRYGQALWTYIAGRYGEPVVGRMLATAAPSGDPKAAIREVLGTSADSLIADWHAATKTWNQPVAAATLTPSKQGQALVVEKKGVGRLNLSPALSPDGQRMMFLSERSRFSVEMYLADARTGKIERQVTKTAVDPHFQSLGFIASAGAFSPDGKRFAFAATSDGRPVISVLDVARGRRVEEKRFEQLGEISTPSWSPDGRSVVFSALAGGYTDLWVLDLASGNLKRLTQDLHADLQPAWSPDGRRIAFVTDRFATDERRGYRLALIDAEGGTPVPVAAFDGAKHINPAWSADGSSLYFVSDRNGISDIYRVQLATGETRQLTHLVTGVSGITALSPAFSVADGAQRLVFSAYENGSTNLYRLEGEAALAGEALQPAPSPTAGLLPPGTKATPSLPGPADAVAQIDTTTFRRSNYRSRLSLDTVSQVSLGVAGGSSGVGVGGGVALFWSDMLGDHNLATQLQVLNGGGNFVNNTAFVVGYWNLKPRLNWGLQASQIPYVTSDFIQDVVDVNGQPTLRQREIRYWQIDRALQASTAYPFSRFRRVEMSAGVRHISFDTQVESQFFDQNGFFLGSTTEDVPGANPDALTLATAGAALVFDNTVFGGTGPVLGHRYRFEVDPVIGSIDFTEVLGDYRHYLPVVKPLLLAGRVLHYGRYGYGGEDGRLSPLFIGYPSLVRGYDAGSFSLAECQSNVMDSFSCPEFDRLLGSRIAVANIEARLPLLGALGLIPSPGVPPIETAFFFDAGSAWRRGDKPRFLDGSAETVSSFGVALRANLFGFAVGEVDYVHPNDRPLKGWFWQFSIQPGF